MRILKKIALIFSSVSILCYLASCASTTSLDLKEEENEVVDTDGDGIPDSEDNCPSVANAGQEDADSDGRGDACPEGDGGGGGGTVDSDGDGIHDGIDNCKDTANQNQADFDEDGIGDVCDDDKDNDGKKNTEDNCPDTANEDQANIDQDEFGNVCDDDRDGDGIPNTQDQFPDDPKKSGFDRDEDGVDDIADNCPDVYNPLNDDGSQDAEACECNSSNTLVITPDGSEDSSIFIQNNIEEVIVDTSLKCLQLNGHFPVQNFIWITESITIFGSQGTKLFNNLEDTGEFSMFKIELSGENQKVYIRGIEFDGDAETSNNYTRGIKVKTKTEARNAKVFIEGCVFKNHRMNPDNGRIIDGGTIDASLEGIQSHVTIRKSSLTNNSIFHNDGNGQSSGGAIRASLRNEYSTLYIQSNTIENNKAEGVITGSGGGIMLFIASNHSYGHIEGNTITGNQAIATGDDKSAYGGGVYISAGGNNTKVNVTDNVIRNNSADADHRYGGGIYIAPGSDNFVTIDANEITGNNPDDVYPPNI